MSTLGHTYSIYKPGNKHYWKIAENSTFPVLTLGKCIWPPFKTVF